MEKIMTKVMVFGTFDGLHEGHLDFFRQAKKYGDYLVVAVARDVNVKKIKNKLPVNNENERLNIVKQCSLVDEARLGYENDPYKIIQEVNPDVICIGYDQNSFNKNLEARLKELGLDIKIYTLKAYRPEQFKSSIVNNLKNGK